MAKVYVADKSSRERLESNPPECHRHARVETHRVEEGILPVPLMHPPDTAKMEMERAHG